MTRLRTYIPYFQDDTAIKNVTKNLDEFTKKEYIRLADKIKLLTQYEILERDLLFDKSDNKLSRDFAIYMLRHGDNTFAMNAFYGKRLQKKYNIDLDQKDILDFGACEGDTSISFAELYHRSKVYAFEPEKRNFELLQSNIVNGGFEKRIIPVFKGVGAKNETLSTQGHGAGATITDDGNNTIQITTIDDFVRDTGVTPGLMKWDIEGMEYDSILGAEHTIKKYKPILLISIYHTGKDFFEIKPLIESRNLGYTFGIERQHSSHPFADTLLVCY